MTTRPGATRDSARSRLRQTRAELVTVKGRLGNTLDDNNDDHYDNCADNNGAVGIANEEKGFPLKTSPSFAVGAIQD